MCARMLAWLALAAAVCGPAAGHSFLNNIGENLMTDMDDVMEMSEVPYTEPVDNTTYASSAVFDMRAMGPVYNASPIIIDFISKKNAYPEGMLKVSDGHLEFASPKENWRTLLAHYAGPVTVITFCLLFVIGLPLAGLFWCCCYWCRSSRRRRPFDRKYDGCIKVLLAIILILLLTLFLFGVVCAFATEQQLEEGAAQVPAAVRAGVQAARSFLNTTDQHAQLLLVGNFGQLSGSLMNLFTRAGLTVSVQLGQFSHAVSVTLLNKMVQQLDEVQRDLRTVQELTATLRFKAEQLNSGLRKVKHKLLRTLVECDMPPCLQLQHKYRISELNTDIQYSQMPDVSALLNNVTSLLDSRIKEEVADGQRVFRDIQRGIQRSVDDHIPVMRDVVHSVGNKLSKVASSVSQQLGNASAQLAQAADQVEQYGRLYDSYGFYRRYVALAAAACLLLVTCILSWGLMCGVCGKRPDVYGATDCCNKGAGSKCLLCGMAVVFCLGGAVAAVLAAYFVAGLAAQRLVCDPLTEPRGNRVIADVEKFVDLEQAVFRENKDPEFTLTGIMVRCHRNNTIYETLRLQRVLDLAGLRARLEAQVQLRAAELRPAYPAAGRRIAILKDSAKRKLQQLADTGLSEFEFERILLALETNMTSLELPALAATLHKTAAAVAERAGYGAVAAELRAAAGDLLELHQDIVAPMMTHTATLNSTATRLRDELRFNHTSLKDAVSYLMYETSQAELFLNTRGADMLQNITRRFTSMVTGMVSGYMDKLVESATTRLGRCGPLSQAFNSTRDAGCRHILLPVHGYWISLAWCVLLFVPLLIVSHRLARLYLQVDPYPGPLVEAEYLYDAYADRDNVPLANAYKAEKRGRGGPRAAAAPCAGAAGPCDGRARGEGAALAAPADTHHARRYNDMAPKHWEEGPPRYHGPTEYERPPPYYYPGPNDRQ